MTQTTYKLGRTCSICPAIIYDHSITGTCKRCMLQQRNRSPEGRQSSRRIGLGNWRRNLLTPEIQAKRIAAIRNSSRKHLQWLPAEYRDEYRRLVRSGVGQEKARAKIEAKIIGCMEGAVNWLRRIAPIRVEGNGYRYGYTLLSPDEVIERARRKGWEPYAHRPSGTLGGVSGGWL
jgi:hypothetical protein